MTDRAIPAAIFHAEPAVKHSFLRQWLKDPTMSDFDIRAILDWDYYTTRLGGTIQKIVTIPAALQGVPNPVPRVPHPEWLIKKAREKLDPFKQRSIKGFFSAAPRVSEGGAGGGGGGGGSGGGARGVVDMEDIGSSHAAAAAALPRVARTSQVARVPVGEDDSGAGDGSGGGDAGGGGGGDGGAATAAPETPAFRSPEWLAQRKAQWRTSRAKKRARAAGNAGGGSGGGGGGAGGGSSGGGAFSSVLGYMRGVSEVANRAHWQIIELRPTTMPGTFTVFAMTSPTAMLRQNLVVPRTFYINYRGEIGVAAAAIGVPDARSLPRGHKMLNLVRVTMPEPRFLRKHKDLVRDVADPNVEGVYETGTPLLMRAKLALGCVARLSPASRAARTGRAGGDFDLAEFEYLDAGAFPYLEPASAVLRRLYVYSSAAVGGRGVVGFFVLEQTPAEAEARMAAARARSEANGAEAVQRLLATEGFSATAKVWIVNPVASGDRPPFRRYFEELSSDNPGDSVAFTRISVVRSMGEAWRGLSAAVDEYRGVHKGPTVVVTQCHVPGAVLQRTVAPLAEFPIVVRPYAHGDLAYPVLANWQGFAARLLVERYVSSHVWWGERLAKARYCQVPVGNLGSDSYVAMADVFFARALDYNKHVLWSSGNNDSSLNPDVAADLCAVDDVIVTCDSAMGAGCARAPVRMPGMSRLVLIITTRIFAQVRREGRPRVHDRASPGHVPPRVRGVVRGTPRHIRHIPLFLRGRQRRQRDAGRAPGTRARAWRYAFQYVV